MRLVSLRLGVEPGPPGWLLPGVKSTSYAVNMAGEAEARSRGADDAVFLANGDVVLEAPISNIWWRRGDTLYTPSLEVGVLAGVTRATLLELAPQAGYRVARGRVHRRPPARRRGGVHLVVDPRGHAGRRARRPRRSARARPARPPARSRRRSGTGHPSG